jgi:hypothetical protein
MRGSQVSLFSCLLRMYHVTCVCATSRECQDQLVFVHMKRVTLRVITHILICRCCQYAMVPSHVKIYLNTHHKRLSIQQRADFVSRVERSTELAKIHTNVIYLSLTEPPITSLPLFFDGLRYNGTDARGKSCTYVSRTLYRMQEHYKKEHQ